MCESVEGPSRTPEWLSSSPGIIPRYSGAMTTETIAPREVVALAVVVRPPRAPRATGPSESARAAVMLPDPVPVDPERSSSLAGVVSVTALEDFAPQ
jgi:hypothetical protein